MAIADRIHDRVRVSDWAKKRALVRAELELGICGQLYARRRDLGLTEDDVAKQMDSTQPKVSEFERGESNATFDYISRYAAVVGLMPVVTFKPIEKLPTDK